MINTSLYENREIKIVSTLPTVAKIGTLVFLTTGTVGLYEALTPNTFTLVGAGGSGSVGSGAAGQFPYYAAAGTTLTAGTSLASPLTVGSGGQPTAICNILLPNVTFPQSAFINIGSGNVDLYTPPAGRRAYIGYRVDLTNSTAGSITILAQIKISGIYYDLTVSGAGTSVGANTLSSLFITPNLSPLIISNGQTISVNTTATGMSVFLEIIEFDSALNLQSIFTTSFGVGNTTIYTVPNGKTALVSGGNFFNRSGASRTINLNLVPSGGSVTNNNLWILSSRVVSGPGAANITVLQPVNMLAGDFISLNDDAATATQYSFLNILER